MEPWISWTVFLAILAAGYFYYTQQKPGVTRGRTTTRSAATPAKETTLWSDEDVKSKAPRKPLKNKAPRKTVTKAVQEAGQKAEAYRSPAAGGADGKEASTLTAPAIASKKAPSGNDVSDMLAPRAAAPVVLNIKAPEKPARPAKVQKPTEEVSQETKKQRQNRKKVEDAKVAREEDEKQRQALLEKQRRTAREARGEPAKNGLQAATAPESSPWTAVPSRGAVQPPVPATSGQLLDTFDAPSTTSSSDGPTNGTLSSATSIANLSEEDQIRIALEASAWTTVPKGGKKQRKLGNDEAVEEASNFAAQEPPTGVKPTRPTQALTEGQKTSTRYQILEQDLKASSDDSDWPVIFK